MTLAARSVSVRSFVLAGQALILSACTESGGGTSYVAMNDNDNLFFADFSSGRIRRIVLSGTDLTCPACPASPTMVGVAAC